MLTTGDAAEFATVKLFIVAMHFIIYIKIFNMKLKNIAWLLIIALCSIFTACKKVKEPPTELSKLPPATQTGANTFGCLVNGKAWVAQTDCKYLCNSPFKMFYNPSLGGGLSIIAFIEQGANVTNKQIIFSFDSI